MTLKFGNVHRVTTVAELEIHILMRNNWMTEKMYIQYTKYIKIYA